MRKSGNVFRAVPEERQAGRSFALGFHRNRQVQRLGGFVTERKTRVLNSKSCIKKWNFRIRRIALISVLFTWEVFGSQKSSKTESEESTGEGLIFFNPSFFYLFASSFFIPYENQLTRSGGLEVMNLSVKSKGLMK